MPPKTGRLFLIVGPSGVGKDSVLDMARAHFEGAPNVLFPKRIITRAANAGGEAHITEDEATFQARAAAGDFALSWQAHGFYYGIAKDICADIDAGRHVVINVSRTVINAARESFSHVTVIAITAQPEIIAARLQQRGRETATEIAKRIERAALSLPTDADVRTIDNSGTLEDALAALRTIISASE
tara:strand:+ start:13682 stop:14239 length:558 start_codon:yes stop_codon:yes gene_type:complete